jgi:8-oxo-dGTP pyrophosphatase MutT (NUDIX family)
MPTLDDVLRARLPLPGPWMSTELRLAAVVCPIVQHGGEDCVLLAVRPRELRQHGGQIGFPGGMREGDEEPLACALRECKEEIGVGSDALTVLGMLRPRESSTGILAHCFVARMQAVPLVPDPREVERLLHVPLADLRDEARWQDREPPLGAPGLQPRTSPHFAFGDDLLWGLTARFVRELTARLGDPA